MSRWMLALPVTFWLALPCPGRAAFFSCEDAHNYGENSGRLFVSQSFSRADCDEVLIDTVQNALTRMLATQVLQTSDSDQEKLCFFEGLWDGVVGQTSEEYQACGGSDEFACVQRGALAAHAGGLLRAVSGTFSDDELLGAEAMTFIYGIEASLLSGAPLCGPLPTQSCAQVTRDRAGPRVVSRLPFAAGVIAETVCSGAR
jgi:hypothetical protein